MKNTVRDFPPRYLVSILFIISVFAVTINFFIDLLYYSKGGLSGPRFLAVIKAIDISTVYGSFLLVLCAITALLAYPYRESERGHLKSFWVSVAVTFLVLSLAKANSLFSSGFGFVRSIFESREVPVLSFVFVIAVIVVLIILSIWLSLHFPRRIRRLFVIAACIYISGAIVMEELSELAWHFYGPKTVVYPMVSSVEELLEMIGCIIFIHAVSLYRRSQPV